MGIHGAIRPRVNEPRKLNIMTQAANTPVPDRAIWATNIVSNPDNGYWHYKVGIEFRNAEPPAIGQDTTGHDTTDIIQFDVHLFDKDYGGPAQIRVIPSPDFDFIVSEKARTCFNWDDYMLDNCQGDVGSIAITCALATLPACFPKPY